MEWAALAVHKTVDVQLKFRGVMGVSTPLVEAHANDSVMPYSLGDTTAALDAATAAFRAALERIPELSQPVTSGWQLAGELRNTQRRGNALEHIFIPNDEETIVFIESSLEERDREEMFRLKQLKTRQNRQAVEGELPKT